MEETKELVRAELRLKRARALEDKSEDGRVFCKLQTVPTSNGQRCNNIGRAAPRMRRWHDTPRDR